jgi:hypothetical protein
MGVLDCRNYHGWSWRGRLGMYLGVRDAWIAMARLERYATTRCRAV